MANTYVIVNGELYHHGTKGMKWGRRRYQNPDGSLTPAGRKRYGSGESSFDRWKKERAAKKEAKKDAKVEAKSADRGYTQRRVKGMTDDGVNKAISRSQLEERYNQQVRSKNAKEGSYRGKALKDMNDDELAKAIERTKMEQEYKRLNPEKVSFGKTVATKFLNEALVPAAIGAGKNFLEKTFNKFVDKAVGVEVDELAKLKREFDIEDYKKKIHDLKNPKEDINETINRLKKEKELKDLNDEELQNLKDAAERAKLRTTISKGVDPEAPVTNDDILTNQAGGDNKKAENDAGGANATNKGPNSTDSGSASNNGTASKGKTIITNLLGPGQDGAKRLPDIEGSFTDKTGNNSSKSSISKGDASRIKSMRKTGKTYAEIAAELGVSESAIKDLLNS